MFDLKHAVTIDYETLPIEDRPRYPPEPVGVSIKVGARRPTYYAFGHRTGNTHSWGDARHALLEAYESGRPLLFHNENFDVDVGETFFGLPRLPWTRYLDTLPALFLLDPRALTYSLKPSAERYLKQKPDERDAVVDWLIVHQPIPGKRLSKAKGPNYAGAFVAYAPPSIVGPYANGDVDRTFDLAELAFKELRSRSMLEPYDRERKLFPILLEMERQGVRVDERKLQRDIDFYHATLDRLETWLKQRLEVDIETFNLDSGQELAEALVAAGAATREGLGTTKTGKLQTNKAAFENGVTDPQVAASLRYRAAANTCLRTFMEPWYEVAKQSGGLIYTRWHSTRREHHESGVGTRTGRLSSTPNFQNIPTEFKPLFKDKANPKLPRPPVELPPLPFVREYILPDSSDHVLIDRDYSQQELRLLGHYEDGVLKDEYRKKPLLDVHGLMQERINNLLGTSYDRKPIKNTGFGILYGMGLGSLAERLDTSVENAKKLRDAYYAVLPGLKDMYADMKERSKSHVPIRTWGGREYYCEEPKLIEGRLWSFDYKLLNLLIQGSAADVTKEAVIRYHAIKPAGHRLRLTVHDQLVASVPRSERDDGMRALRIAMESIETDVPMLSDGTYYTRGWDKRVRRDFKDTREDFGAGVDHLRQAWKKAIGGL
jgi:DNA polymerase-1